MIRFQLLRHSAIALFLLILSLHCIAAAPPAAERIGDIRPLNLRISSDDPSSWNRSIRSPGATFVKIHFQRMELQPGDTLLVSDATGEERHLYPGNAASTGADAGGFWSLSVSGEEALIRFQPAASRARGAAVPVADILIDRYADGFAGPSRRTPQPGQENLCGTSQLKSVACYQTTHPTEYARARAVAQLIITRTDGTFACTGWRVGPGNLMLTNQHCIASQADTANTEIWFNYQLLECNGSRAAITRIGGDTLLKVDEELDFALFTVKNFETISNFGYLELDLRTPVRNEEIYIPQHPQARSREFGIESDANAGNICRIDTAITDGLGFNTDTGYWCDTESGSSGSPVLARSSHKVIGLHHLGYRNCEDTNLAVRIDLIYPLIRPFMGGDAMGTPRGWLDTPTNGASLSGTVTLAGWATVVSGNTAGLPSRVELFVDGSSAGLLVTGLDRPDVQRYLSTFGINSPVSLGFSGSWNSRTVGDGPHQLAIRVSDAAGQALEAAANVAEITVTTNNGIAPSSTTTTTTTSTSSTSTTTTSTSTTTSSTLPPLAGMPLGWLDAPAEGQTLTGMIPIAGWAAIRSGSLAGPPSRMELLIDGLPVAQLATGVSRPDVQQYFARQGISAPTNLGFAAPWDSRTVIDGQHRLAVRAFDAAGVAAETIAEIGGVTIITNNGINTTTTIRPATTTTTIRPATTTTTPASTTTTTSTTTTSTVPGMSIRGFLEVPSEGQAVSGTVSGGGWTFIMNHGVAQLPAKVEMLIDGTLAAQAATGFDRPDVVSHFVSQGVTVPPNSGFRFNWDSRSVAPGNHIMTIRVADLAGQLQEAVFELARITVNVQPTASGWLNMAAQDFEGVFPGAWEVVDTAAKSGHEYFWGKRSCRVFAGSFSGWGVGGGANGAALPCNSLYPELVDSWLAYGPINLADTSQAEMTFKLWMNSEAGFDFVCRLASTDGTDFYGTCTSGNTGGWVDRRLDLTNVPDLGNLTGKQGVWVALLFTSDSASQVTEGGYVDNVVLRKCTSGPCTSSTGLEASGSGGKILEWPIRLRKP